MFQMEQDSHLLYLFTVVPNLPYRFPQTEGSNGAKNPGPTFALPTKPKRKKRKKKQGFLIFYFTIVKKPHPPPFPISARKAHISVLPHPFNHEPPLT